MTTYVLDGELQGFTTTRVKVKTTATITISNKNKNLATAGMMITFEWVAEWWGGGDEF